MPEGNFVRAKRTTDAAMIRVGDLGYLWETFFSIFVWVVPDAALGVCVVDRNQGRLAEQISSTHQRCVM